MYIKKLKINFKDVNDVIKNDENSRSTIYKIGGCGHIMSLKPVPEVFTWTEFNNRFARVNNCVKTSATAIATKKKEVLTSAHMRTYADSA